MSNELHGLKVECLESELKTFNPPSGQTCSEWASEYVTAVGGYLTDATSSATSNCQLCAYKSGDEFFAPLGIEFTTRYRDLGILCVKKGKNGERELVGCGPADFH